MRLSAYGALFGIALGSATPWPGPARADTGAPVSTAAPDKAYREYLDCRPIDCPGISFPTGPDACLTTTNGATRVNWIPEYQKAVRGDHARHNEMVRAGFSNAGRELEPEYIVPEETLVKTLIVSPRRHWDSTREAWVGSETHLVHAFSDSRTGRIFKFSVEVRNPPHRANPDGVREFWDPRLGFKAYLDEPDAARGEVRGTLALPGEGNEQKGQAFDALLGYYLGRASGCGFVQDHEKAVAIERDPALAAIDAFFQPCSIENVSFCAETTGHAAPPEAVDDLLPVVDSLGEGDEPLSEPEEITNQRFNLELIHTVRTGLLNSQAEILTYVSDDPLFDTFSLGDHLSDWSPDFSSQGTPGTQPECDLDSGGRRYRFNDRYHDAIRTHATEIRDPAPEQADLRRRLMRRANHRLALDALEYAFWQCWFDTSPTGAVTAEARERMHELKNANKELALMGHGPIMGIYKALKKELPGTGGTYDFSAYSTSDRHCRSDDARSELGRLTEKVRSLDPSGPELTGMFEASGKTVPVRDAVRKARKTELNRLRKGLREVTQQCRSADVTWDPTWVPSWLGGDDDGVPLWKDRRVVEDVVRRYANASPPRTRDLERFRQIACKNGRLQSDADDTKFWVDLGVGGGMLVLTLATFGAADIAVVGLAARAVVLADVSMGVAAGYAMVQDARASFEHFKLLNAAGFASSEEVEAAAKMLTEAYWLGGITAGVSLVFGYNDIASLARSGFVARQAGGFAAREGTEDILKALQIEGRQIPGEILDQALLSCRDGDCAGGHAILARWAREPEVHEAALRGFGADDWKAFSELDARLADLEAKQLKAFSRGWLDEAERLGDRLRTAKAELNDFFENWGTACAR